MPKLLLLQGLPGAGKSTKAAELLAEYGNAVRVNRDSLREMLHTGLPWSGKQERITKDVARTMVKHLLAGESLDRSLRSATHVGTVIIDDCNLHQPTVESWRSLAQECGAKFEILRLDTPVEECLIRDAVRKKSVGRSVIVGMAMQFGLYPKPNLGFAIVDIDGTIADIRHRLHYVQQEPKDWDGFFEAMVDDTLREDVASQVRDLWEGGYEVVFVSGRPDTYRGLTEAWLRHVGIQYYIALFMRRGGDHRPDTVVKEEILTTYFPDTSLIFKVIDDRKSVIAMWRQHGLDVVDVGDGSYF